MPISLTRASCLVAKWSGEVLPDDMMTLLHRVLFNGDHTAKVRDMAHLMGLKVLIEGKEMATPTAASATTSWAEGSRKAPAKGPGSWRQSTAAVGKCRMLNVPGKKGPAKTSIDSSLASSFLKWTSA